MKAGALPREYYIRRDHTVEVPAWPVLGRANRFLPLADGLALMRAKGAEYKRSFCIEVCTTDTLDLTMLLWAQLASRGECGWGPGRGPYRIVNRARMGEGKTLYHDTREAMFATFEDRLARYLVGDLEAL